MSSQITPAYPLVNDALMIGGRSLDEHAAHCGHTPFYVLDKDIIQDRIAWVRNTMPDDVDLFYAIKANPNPKLLDFITPQVDGYDISSLGELLAAISSGMPGNKLSFAGPGKLDEELKVAIKHEVVISVESEGELERLLKISENSDKQANIAIRINPDFTLKASGMRMGGGAQAFGIDEERLPHVLRELDTKRLNFLGFHVYTGSQNLHAEQIIATQNAIFDLLERLIPECPNPISWFNIGGGFGIPYYEGDRELDLTPIGNNLEARVKDLRGRFPNIRIVLELGRYLVGEAGAYVTRVIDRKVSRGETFLIMDGGMHQHLAASGNLGQVIRRNFPVVNPKHVFEGERETVNISGPLCTPLDRLASKIEIAKAEPGDLLVILQSGAYGLTASPVNFLSHEIPEEILV